MRTHTSQSEIIATETHNRHIVEDDAEVFSSLHQLVPHQNTHLQGWWRWIYRGERGRERGREGGANLSSLSDELRGIELSHHRL